MIGKLWTKLATRAGIERIAAAALGLAALALLGMGVLRTHKVYDPTTEEFGIAAFNRVSDRDLVVDATFGGVRRDADRLYSTYDRSLPRGKSACPT